MARTTYLSTVILNINGLKGQSMDQKIKIRTYPAYKRPASGQNTQTEIKVMENDILCKWKRKISWGSNTYIRQRL